MDNMYSYIRSRDFERLKSERERLATFTLTPDWPVTFVSPEDCARAGFFFLQDGDKVQCPFCRGMVGEWEIGDQPITEHRRHFPSCPFVLNLPVGNIPMGQEPRIALERHREESLSFGAHVRELTAHTIRSASGSTESKVSHRILHFSELLEQERICEHMELLENMEDFDSLKVWLPVAINLQPLHSDKTLLEAEEMLSESRDGNSFGANEEAVATFSGSNFNATPPVHGFTGDRNDDPLLTAETWGSFLSNIGNGTMDDEEGGSSEEHIVSSLINGLNTENGQEGLVIGSQEENELSEVHGDTNSVEPAQSIFNRQNNVNILSGNATVAFPPTDTLVELQDVSEQHLYQDEKMDTVDNCTGGTDLSLRSSTTAGTTSVVHDQSAEIQQLTQQSPNREKALLCYQYHEKMAQVLLDQAQMCITTRVKFDSGKIKDDEMPTAHFVKASVIDAILNLPMPDCGTNSLGEPETISHGVGSPETFESDMNNLMKTDAWRDAYDYVRQLKIGKAATSLFDNLYTDEEKRSCTRSGRKCHRNGTKVESTKLDRGRLNMILYGIASMKKQKGTTHFCLNDLNDLSEVDRQAVEDTSKRRPNEFRQAEKRSLTGLTQFCQNT